MYEEFKTFNQMIKQHDMKAAKERMQHSMTVMNVVDAALKDSGIKLG